MRSPVLVSLAATALLCCTGSLLAQEKDIPWESHPWGRFRPGAWKQVRVFTETFDERGTVSATSRTETKSTLEKITKAGVAIAVEILVEVAGKRFDGEPQVIRQGLHGESLDQKVEVKNLGTEVVTIEGRQIPCQVEQVESLGGSARTLTRTFWSAQVAPYILRRESTTTDLDGKEQSRSSVEVVALNMPCRILGQIRSTAHVKTVVTHAKGTTTALSITSVDVPGGVVCHMSQEFDEQGHLVRRSRLELVDYGLEPANERWGLLQRLRWHRLSRPSPNSAQ